MFRERSAPSNENLSSLQQLTSSLREKIVWHRGQNGRYSSLSLFKLYSIYFQEKFFSDQKSSFIKGDISISGREGIYYPLEGGKWVEKRYYLGWLYQDLLNDKLPKRDFRVRSCTPVSALTGLSLESEIQVYIWQLCKSGIFFYIPSLNCLRKIKESQTLIFKADLRVFEEIQSLSLKDLEKYLLKYPVDFLKSEYAENDYAICSTYIDESISFDNPYFFVPFKSMSSSFDARDIKKIIPEFIGHIQDEFLKEIHK